MRDRIGPGRHRLFVNRFAPRKSKVVLNLSTKDMAIKNLPHFLFIHLVINDRLFSKNFQGDQRFLAAKPDTP